MVSVPVQLGSRRENERIRAGEEPGGWNEARKRQKDIPVHFLMDGEEWTPAADEEAPPAERPVLPDAGGRIPTIQR